MTLVIVKVLELAGEDGFNERDDGDDDEEERRYLPWLFDVVIDVAEEDEADARADHDTVLEVVANRLIQRLVVCQAPLPNVDVLFAQSVEEVERVAD